jgi:hypothetical protein
VFTADKCLKSNLLVCPYCYIGSKYTIQRCRLQVDYRRYSQLMSNSEAAYLFHHGFRSDSTNHHVFSSDYRFEELTPRIGNHEDLCRFNLLQWFSWLASLKYLEARSPSTVKEVKQRMPAYLDAAAHEGYPSLHCKKHAPMEPTLNSAAPYGIM